MMNSDDSPLETWLEHRRGTSAADRGFTDAVMARLVKPELEKGASPTTGRFALLPKPALALLCFLAGVGKIWFALQIAF